MRKSAILALALLASTAANAAHKREGAKPPSAAPAAAASRSAAKPAQQLSLTIYNNDLVMVQDIRTLDLPAGRSRIAFPDVSAAIRPETVSLTSRGLSVVEQNFDYDLLTPAKMMEKQVGPRRPDRAHESATGRADHRDRNRAFGQFRCRLAHRQEDRGAARRRPAHARRVRLHPGEFARLADACRSPSMPRRRARVR